MKRIVVTLTLTLSFVSILLAQTVITTGEAPLLARPDATAELKTTLPIGLELEVISEQDDWVAVRLKTGTVGWIQKVYTNSGGVAQPVYTPPDPQPAQTPPAEQPSPPEPAADDTDDLLQSIRDLAEQEVEQPTETPPPPAPPAQQTPPAANQQPPAQQPPPPTFEQPLPTQQQPPPAQPTTRTDPPPPPPPRPDRIEASPTYAGSSSRPSITSLIGGFYDAKQYVTAAFRFADNARNMELSWNQLIGKLAQITGYGDLTQIVDAIGDTYGSDGFGALSKAGKVMSEGHKLYLGKGGARLSAFPLQPGDKSPVGVYLSAFASYGTFFGPDSDHWAVESIDGVMNVGGEGGLFMKYGEDIRFIPRVAFQFDRETWMVSEADSNPSVDLKRVLLSLEMDYKGIIPGIQVLLTDSDVGDEGFTTTFGFNLSFAL